MRVLGVLFVLVLAPTSTPQTRLDRALRGPIARTIETAMRSTVSVHVEGRRVGYGVIINEGGWIVTKSSSIEGYALDDAIEVKLDGRLRVAKLVRRFDRDDIALLRFTEGKQYPVAEWRNTRTTPMRPGQLAFSVGVRDAVGFGVVGVGTRRVPREKGFLGVFLEDAAEGSGARVSRTEVDSAARRAGLRTGDVVVRVDEHAISDTEDLVRAVSSAGAGAKLKLEVRRNDRDRTVEAVLGSRSESPEELRLSGGELSDRRTGFHSAYQHDGGISARECGSAVVDVDGRIAGLNIARAGRVRSYAIPAQRVLDLVLPVIDSESR